jgi:DtxR family Mn-dependent transcriptional regulator
MSYEKLSTEAVENYLKAIYTLSLGNSVDAEPSEDVQGASQQKIANVVGVTVSGVSKMLRTMQQAELIEYSPYKPVVLTKSGEKTAVDVIRRHRLIELWLIKSLGFGWESVHREAERLEHYISDEIITRIEQTLDFPEFDPHGDPIPNKLGEMRHFSRKSLASCESGDSLKVSRVTDEDETLLKYLAEKGIRPGVNVSLIEIEPFGGSYVIQILDSEMTRISPYAAQHVFVEVEGK